MACPRPAFPADPLVYSVLNDGIVGARVVKAFGQEKYEDQRFGKVNATVRDAEMNLVRFENAYSIALHISQRHSESIGLGAWGRC